FAAVPGVADELAAGVDLAGTRYQPGVEVCGAFHAGEHVDARCAGGLLECPGEPAEERAEGCGLAGVEVGVVEDVPVRLDQQPPRGPPGGRSVADPPGAVVYEVAAGRHGESGPCGHGCARVLAADQAVLARRGTPAEQPAERVTHAG